MQVFGILIELIPDSSNVLEPILDRMLPLPNYIVVIAVVPLNALSPIICTEWGI